MTYWRNHLTLEKQQSTTPLTTSLKSGGNGKGSPHLVAIGLASSVSKHSTNVITATFHCSITLLEKPMPWPMHASACGIYLTPNCLPILPFTAPIVDHGCSATCIKPMHCALISALSVSVSRPELQNGVPTPQPSIGLTGMHSAWPTMPIPIFRPGKLLSPCYKSSVKGIEMDACPPPQARQS
jgi:hypothetical protein